MRKGPAADSGLAPKWQITPRRHMWQQKVNPLTCFGRTRVQMNFPVCQIEANYMRKQTLVHLNWTNQLWCESVPRENQPMYSIFDKHAAIHPCWLCPSTPGRECGSWSLFHTVLLCLLRWCVSTHSPRCCGATQAWTTWLRQLTLSSRTQPTSTRCSQTSTVLTSIMYRSALPFLYWHLGRF